MHVLCLKVDAKPEIRMVKILSDLRQSSAETSSSVPFHFPCPLCCASLVLERSVLLVLSGLLRSLDTSPFSLPSPSSSWSIDERSSPLDFKPFSKSLPPDFLC